ncbi:uncharacterized protein RCC_03952 [Ramularia collo-cygni]|uniref:F-box domain-containing protein n=1 Tax=Ramularia collo-cygni TaxID=112498 RepID=A0A2D3UP30_9PEZI|nr:uncharacterized protein RCC_03952 [Ramularia collo-cygni]CZT18112.1 uncharacterized protein RCC_03952 [Ramularia collo-cygni]
MATPFDTKDQTACGSATAASRVFGILELAEGILLYLPITDLIHVSRVSKRFQHTVAASKPLQRALFLKPLAGKTVILVKPTPGRMVFLADETSDMSVGVLGNPFVQRVMQGLNHHDDAALLRKDATWRRMLLSQPPMRRIEDKYGRKFRDDQGVKLLQALVASEKRPQWYRPNHIEAWEFFKRVKLAGDVRRIEKPLSEDDRSLHHTFHGMQLG